MTMAKKKEYQGADVVPEYTTNVNGVRIKKCCASCAFKQPLDANGGHRLCTLGGGKKVVFKDELCKQWHISTEIDRIRTKGFGV